MVRRYEYSFLDRVLHNEYHLNVKASELKRRLEKEGCSVTDGTRHWIVSYHGIQTTIPRHPSKEVRTGTYYEILKQLGIKRK
jgi:mRNA interferase HicA